MEQVVSLSEMVEGLRVEIVENDVFEGLPDPLESFDTQELPEPLDAFE